MPYTIEAPEKPCTIDLTEKRFIRRRFRDIINMESMPLIYNKHQANNKQIRETKSRLIDEMISEFKKKAREAGWAKEILDTILEEAINYGTIFEPLLERAIPEKGDLWKYDQKKRISKSYNDKDFAAFKTEGAWAG